MEDLSNRVVIVGGGPAGVSAAWALVEGGARVMMIDAGLERPPPGAPWEPLSRLRQSSEAAFDQLIGKALENIAGKEDLSPKIRYAVGGGFLDAFAPANAIRERDFQALGALAPGGLSNLWGGIASFFDADDLRGFPVSRAELLPSYRAVAGRVGISGARDDDLAAFHGTDYPLLPPLPLSTPAATLLNAYQRQRDRKSGRSLGRPPDDGSSPGLTLGRSRNAALSEPLHDRPACHLDQACMWGCRSGAVYNSADDAERLAATHPDRFTRMDGLVVKRVERVERVERAERSGHLGGSEPPAYRLICHDRRSGQERVFRTGKLVLAAGAIASTRLALALLERFDAPVALLNTPSLAFALWLPRLLGAPLDATGYGMAQLNFRQSLPGFPGSTAFGALYDAQALAAADLIARMPLTRRGAVSMLRALLPGMVVGVVYLDGDFSQNSATLRRDAAGRAHLEIQGGRAAAFEPARIALARCLRRGFRRLGGWLLPGSLQVMPQGGDVHYGGTLPMGSTVSRFGELTGAPGVFVADGSVFNRLPARNLTGALMANADRIGRFIAGRTRGDSISCGETDAGGGRIGETRPSS